jgi:hypothetical protein
MGVNENVFWLGDIVFFEKDIPYLKFIFDYYNSIKDKRNDPYLKELNYVIDRSDYALKRMYARQIKLKEILV